MIFTSVSNAAFRAMGSFLSIEIDTGDSIRQRCVDHLPDLDGKGLSDRNADRTLDMHSICLTGTCARIGTTIFKGARNCLTPTVRCTPLSRQKIDFLKVLSLPRVFVFTSGNEKTSRACGKCGKVSLLFARLFQVSVGIRAFCGFP